MLKFIAGYLYTQLQTTIHKFWVSFYTLKYCFKNKQSNQKIKLFLRSLKHDLSKYQWIEAKGFATTIFDLKKSTYGTTEYKKLLDKIKLSLAHHYSKNKHHPEFYANSFKDMYELDKIEMIIDWRAATRRHKNGNIYKSLEINQKRFGYSNEDKIYLKSIIDTIS